MQISINLLPKEKKEEIRAKARYHIALKLVMMASLAVAVYILFVLGCLEVINIQKKAADSEVEKIRKTVTYRRMQGDQELIKDYAKMAGTVETGFNQQKSFKPVFDLVNDISSEGLIYDQMVIDTKKAVLKGEGKHRQEVLDLKSRLEQSGMFNKVDSPISNITQDKDVSFEFNLEFK